MIPRLDARQFQRAEAEPPGELIDAVAALSLADSAKFREEAEQGACSLRARGEMGAALGPRPCCLAWNAIPATDFRDVLRDAVDEASTCALHLSTTKAAPR